MENNTIRYYSRYVDDIIFDRKVIIEDTLLESVKYIRVYHSNSPMRRTTK
jgi:hypothetical protein